MRAIRPRFPADGATRARSGRADGVQRGDEAALGVALRRAEARTTERGAGGHGPGDRAHGEPDRVVLLVLEEEQPLGLRGVTGTGAVDVADAAGLVDHGEHLDGTVDPGGASTAGEL